VVIANFKIVWHWLHYNVKWAQFLQGGAENTDYPFQYYSLSIYKFFMPIRNEKLLNVWFEDALP
jgi:hypothetical protein